jgi:hypothetical protein
MGLTFSCFKYFQEDENITYYTGDPQDSIYKDLKESKYTNYMTIKNKKL